MPDVLNNREGPQAREPSKCLNRWSYRERLAKEAFWSPATRGSKKDSDRAITSVAEAVCVLGHLALPGSPQAKKLHHLHAQLSLGQSCHRQKKKNLVSIYTGLVQSCQTLCNPVDCGLPGFTVRGFCRQEYWSIWANTGCHTLLENYISCCPSYQLLWVPGAARTPVTQAAAPPPHLALTGKTQVLQGRLRSKPPWMTHMQRWK